MPPKKKGNDNTKNKAKALQQKAVDKTFGLKNKNKSKKVQEHIRQVTAQVDGGRNLKKEAENKRKAEEKKAAEQAKKEAAALFGIVQPKVPFGVDPKSVLCEFFKAGVCNKGPKCKFSHDPNVGRKDAKKDLYVDAREQAREEKEKDAMEDWDEDKLRSVIKLKHGNPKTTTDKVCKYFIEAVENQKYGWFWVCPNGGNDCKYKHSLPEGFVLKTKEQRRLERMAEESAPKITLEEFIEMERGKLDKTKFHPITIDLFNEWKKNMMKKRSEDAKKEEAKSKRPKTGREVILERFADKFYTEDDDGGDTFDLTQFKQDLPEEGAAEFKDYGDGSNVTFNAEE